MSENVFYPPFLRAGVHEFAEWANRQALLLHGCNEAAQSFHRHVFFALKKKSGAREVGRGAYLFPRSPQLATAGPLFSVPGAASVRLRFVSASGLFLPFLFLFCVRDDLSTTSGQVHFFLVCRYHLFPLFPCLQIRTFFGAGKSEFSNSAHSLLGVVCLLRLFPCPFLARSCVFFGYLLF